MSEDEYAEANSLIEKNDDLLTKIKTIVKECEHGVLRAKAIRSHFNSHRKAENGNIQLS